MNLTTTFEYDNGSNILRQHEYAYTLAPTDELSDGTERVYGYGNTDCPDQLTEFDGKAIVYDANGCPTTYLGTSCTFGSNRFTYDADGMRTIKNSIAYTYLAKRRINEKTIYICHHADLGNSYGSSDYFGSFHL